MKRVLILLLLFSSISAHGGEDGYLYGENHCFYFSTPKGWVADSTTGRSQGLAFVFYPRGSTWAKAEVIMYAAMIEKSESLKTPKDQVESVLEQFRTEYKSPNIKAEKLKEIKAKSGAVGEIWRFAGDQWGNSELVAYFNGRATINYFVMNSRNTKALNKNGKYLDKLASSYREANDCKPCCINDA